MNKTISIDDKYIDLLKDILKNGHKKGDRTGTGTISVFGREIRHNMSEGFPLLTTKKMSWKSIVTELIWFLNGDTNIKYLVDNGCNIWNGDCYKAYVKAMENHYISGGDVATMEQFIELIKTDEEFAETWGDLGPIYGAQWRNWRKKDGYVDQIKDLINQIKTNPDSRRLMVNAWNVGELENMKLPPCHFGFQIYTRELTFDEFWDRLTPKQMGSFTKPNEGETYSNIDSRVEIMNVIASHHNVPTRAISLKWFQRSVNDKSAA